MADPYEIATWRFEKIAPLIDDSLSPDNKSKALRELTTQPTAWPLSERRERLGLPPRLKRIPKSTLHRWIEIYSKEGYRGLLPKPRADRGTTRRPTILSWIAYAIGLLYEQPNRSLTQLQTYLGLEFEDYDLGRSTLDRHLRAHPAYGGIEELRQGKKRRLRGRYEASRSHESWQIDGKGPFRVRLVDGEAVRVHVLSIIDDFSRAILGTVISQAEDMKAAIRVFLKAAARYGLPDRFQFDRGSAFDSHAFRSGLAQLGIHRSPVKARHPEAQGKIEAYHRCLKRWFIDELRVQEVLGLAHLEQLLDAVIAVVYQRHFHRSIKTTPEKRLAGKISERRVSLDDLARVFWVTTTAKSHPKTGEVRLPNGPFVVPLPFAGQRASFRHDLVRDDLAVLVTKDGREIRLEPFRVKPLPPINTSEAVRSTGQLQKILDIHQGKTRPNAQPGFGLSEVFTAFGKLLDRLVPGSKKEGRLIAKFFAAHGPLRREPFQDACRRAREALGPGRPLTAYIKDLERQIEADRKANESPDQETQP